MGEGNTVPSTLFRLKKAATGNTKDILGISSARYFRSADTDSHPYAILSPFDPGTSLDMPADVLRYGDRLLFAHIT